MHDHKIVRRIRTSSKSATYLAKNSKGEKVAPTYIDNEKVLERMRFKAHLEGRSPDEANAHARTLLDEYLKGTRAMVERIKGLGSEHVAITSG